jgi:hypothetical protein
VWGTQASSRPVLRGTKPWAAPIVSPGICDSVAILHLLVGYRTKDPIFLMLSWSLLHRLYRPASLKLPKACTLLSADQETQAATIYNFSSSARLMVRLVASYGMWKIQAQPRVEAEVVEMPGRLASWAIHIAELDDIASAQPGSVDLIVDCWISILHYSAAERCTSRSTCKA